ncbi:MAG: hypothetical protein ACREFY_02090 [Acetobacteraceae bacterium]
MSDLAPGKKPFVQARPRSGPNDDVRRQRLLAHMRNAPPQAPTQVKQDKPYETRAQELARKQDAVSAIARQERDSFIDMTLSALPDPECIETIRGILAEHELKKPEEAALFKDYDFVEDLDRVSPDRRRKDFAAIIDAMDAVVERRRALDQALGQARANAVTPEQQKAVEEATRLKAILGEHIPDAFWAQQKTLAGRRDGILASRQDKAKALEQEKQGFPEGAKFGERFKEIIEPSSTKSFERTSFYFDTFVSAPPPELQKELYQMTDAMVAKAHRIMDAGGKLADVDTMMASTGLPEAWWPPNFIQEMQAWRKCEREVLRRDVIEQCKQNDYDFTSPGDIVKFMKDQAHNTGSSAKQMFADMLETGEVKKAIGDFTDQLKSNFGFGDDVASALEANEFSSLDPSVAKQLFDAITSAEGTLSGVLGMAVTGLKKAPDVLDKLQGVLPPDEVTELTKLAGSLVPGLALAVAGLNLGLALAELAKQSVMLGVASSLAEESIGRVARGELEDGFALTYALQNEQRARGIAVGKASVKVVTSTIAVVGAGAEVAGAHYGVAVKYGLLVVGKTITYGSQIVFTNIEWAQATKAKDMLAEARAGNPIARIEIFKNAATYAKLYIAILARDGDRTALDFVEKNGIDETTIANKANAIWILEAALRADSGQKAEDEIADGWIDANTGGALSKIKTAVGAIGTAGKAVGNKIHDVRKGDERGADYDKTWSYTGSADISATTWRAAKDGAYKAGLHDDHGTGVSSAVETAEADYSAAVAELRAAGAKPAKPDKTRDIVLAAIASLQGLQRALRQWTPMSNADDNDRQEIHAGMTEFMVRLNATATVNIDELDKTLRTLGLKDTSFQAAISSNPLDPDVWKTNWKGGIEKACLPKNDAGVGSALAKAAKCIGTRDGIARDKNPQNWRRASLALKEALDQVLAATDDCRGPVAEVASMIGALERIRAEAATRLRAMDKEMADPWPDAPSRPSTISSADWENYYKSACDGGAAKTGQGGGIADALDTLDAKEKEIAKNTQDPQKTLAAEIEYREATGQLMLATAELMRGQRDMAEPLKAYVMAIGVFARSEQLAKADVQQKRTFTPTPNLTVAAWEATCKSATESGCVLKNDTIKSNMSKAIAAYLKARETLETQRKGKDYKKIRAAAMATLAALGKLAVAVSGALGDRGFKDNPIMAQYLAQRLDRTRQMLADPALKDEADGMAAPHGEFNPEARVWVAKDWDKAKKQATDNGIIVDGDTGMTPKLKAAITTLNDYGKKKDKTKTPKQREEVEAARISARTRVTELKEFVDSTLKLLSRHRGWLDYVKSWSDLCQTALDQIG